MCMPIELHEVDAIAAALHARMVAAAAPKLDTRTLREAFAEVDRCVLSMQGRFAVSYVRLVRLAVRTLVDAPALPLCAGRPAIPVLRSSSSSKCLAGPAVFARGCRVDRRCTSAAPSSCTSGGSVSLAAGLVPLLGDVRICDLDRSHVLAGWNALAGPSLSTRGIAIVARLRDAEELGFTGCLRWREMWPSIPVGARRHIEVTDEIHREAAACLEWALDGYMSEQVARIVALAMRCPGRLGEICSLRREHLDLRGQVLRLPDSKTGPRRVPLTTEACCILREQLRSLPWDATWVWPSDSATGHVLPTSVSRAWRRITAAWAARKPTPAAAALLRWRMHDHRGALATQAAEHGAAPRNIQRALGHADFRTTEFYLHGTSMAGPRRAMELGASALDRRPS